MEYWCAAETSKSFCAITNTLIILNELPRPVGYQYDALILNDVILAKLSASAILRDPNQLQSIHKSLSEPAVKADVRGLSPFQRVRWIPDLAAEHPAQASQAHATHSLPPTVEVPVLHAAPVGQQIPFLIGIVVPRMYQVRSAHLPRISAKGRSDVCDRRARQWPLACSARREPKSLRSGRAGRQRTESSQASLSLFPLLKPTPARPLLQARLLQMRQTGPPAPSRFAFQPAMEMAKIPT